MRRSDFQFDLPAELIARYPLPERTASRLLVLDGGSGAIRHRRFTEFIDCLRPGDLLIFNDAKVIPARLYGRKATGGRCEILVERLLSPRACLAHIRAGKPPKPGGIIRLQAGPADGDEPEDGTEPEPANKPKPAPNAELIAGELQVTARQDDLFHLQAAEDLLPLLQRIGHTPLPPYIDRPAEAIDQERYQTVYGKRDGAVAAPTAGLHFSEDYIALCRERGAGIGFITLLVGAGTFQPVRADDIEDHRMHAEYLEVGEALCEAARQTRADGGRLVAVGTTAARALETAAADGQLAPFAGDSRLFIRPGYRFRAVDALLTNFHLPESTLLMLVSAFAGQEAVLRAYREAVRERYRFFSYGDAMFILPSGDARA